MNLSSTKLVQLSSATGSLEIQLVDEMAAAWRDGRGPRAEEFFARYPQLPQDPELAVRIIYEEFCQRQASGQTVDPAEMVTRFPQWQAQLEVLLECHRLLEAEGAADFPVAGQQLGEFQLLAELDRGAAGRVFLATQPALSDRPVVVKLTASGGGEHLSLARLQHTHIVPLYLVEDYPERNLRALCMPYLGGTSWARILRRLRPIAPADRQGRNLAEALAEVERAAPLSLRVAGSTLNFLKRATFAQSVCWIGACLAEALQYAHQRGLVHLDIKPSNVLLAGDGQPMLLDFHLARDEIPPNGRPPDFLGGTRGYMSPEQELAMEAVREGRTLALGVDRRSDIYSLGLLLYESLGGNCPASRSSAALPRLEQLNRSVSRGLADMVHKCLAPAPADRYRDAGALAADLRRHLADLPLVGVPNRSLAERWRKWRRRRPHSLTVIGLAVALLAATVATGGVFVSHRLDEATAALAQGQDLFDARSLTQAIAASEQGLNAIAALPIDVKLRRDLRAQLMRAKQAQLADQLHALVQQLRFLFGSDTLTSANLRDLDSGCRTIWDSRRQIMATSSPGLPADTRRQVREDLLDLALLWSDLHVRGAAAKEVPYARRRALAVLNEAQTALGPSAVIERECQIQAEALGETAGAKPATAIPPVSSWWEHYALGRALLAAQELAPARDELQTAISLEPQAFWPNFYQTICQYRLGEYEDSLCLAHVCVALAPDRAECFFNRGLAQQALQHLDRAKQDFSRALALNPSLAAAALARSTVHREQQNWREATDDIRRALASGANPAACYYNLALVQTAQHDRSAALDSVKMSLQHDPTARQTLALRQRLEREP